MKINIFNGKGKLVIAFETKDVINGLAIHKSIKDCFSKPVEFHKRWWTITHIVSGKSLGRWYKTKRKAIESAEEICKIYKKWNQSEKEIVRKVPKKKSDAIKKIMYASYR